MTNEQLQLAVRHNNRVIKSVVIALVENNLADTVKLLSDTDYAAQMIRLYIEAANIAREAMQMEPLFLYDLNK